MMLKMARRWYAYYFCYLLDFFKAGPASWGSESKAIIALIVMEMAVAFAAFLFWVTVSGIDLEFSLHNAWISFPLAFLLYGLNHTVLFRNGAWKRYYESLHSLPRHKQTAGKVISMLVTLTVPVLYAVLIWQVGTYRGTW